MLSILYSLMLVFYKKIPYEILDISNQSNLGYVSGFDTRNLSEPCNEDMLATISTNIQKKKILDMLADITVDIKHKRDMIDTYDILEDSYHENIYSGGLGDDWNFEL